MSLSFLPELSRGFIPLYSDLKSADTLWLSLGQHIHYNALWLWKRTWNIFNQSMLTQIQVYITEICISECTCAGLNLRKAWRCRQRDRKTRQDSSRVVCFRLLLLLLCAMEDRTHPLTWRSKGKGATHMWWSTVQLGWLTPQQVPSLTGQGI